jgi:hypothetical protein
LLLALGLAAAATGCEGGAAPAGAPAADALADRSATAGQAGPGAARLEAEVEAVTTRARSARGLAISPVPVGAGLPARQRAQIGLGSYLVNAASDCAACHSSPAGFLAGGNPFFLDHAGHVVWTRNLTPDPATGLALSLEQFKTSLRTGRDFHAGATRQLVVMPWTTLRWASDVDLEAIYAYLRALPPVVNAVPPDVKDDLPLPAAVPFPGRYTDGVVDRALPEEDRSFDPGRGRAISPLPAPSLPEGQRGAFGVGAYIVNATAHCNDCHTHPDRTPDQSKVDAAAFLTGGTVFAVPPPLQPVFREVRTMSANLEGAANGFLSEPGTDLARFQDIIRTGTHADETPARPLAFPMVLVAANLARLLDADLRAVFTYVDALPRTAGATDLPRQGAARWCAADADCATGETCSLATGECVGGACTTDEDCGACQVCAGGACQAPAPDSACVASAQ